MSFIRGNLLYAQITLEKYKNCNCRPQLNTLYSLLTCRQIEGRVVEISQLQEIFSEKVLHQVRDLALQCHVYRCC